MPHEETGSSQPLVEAASLALASVERARIVLAVQIGRSLAPYRAPHAHITPRLAIACASKDQASWLYRSEPNTGHRASGAHDSKQPGFATLHGPAGAVAGAVGSGGVEGM